MRLAIKYVKKLIAVLLIMAMILPMASDLSIWMNTVPTVVLASNVIPGTGEGGTGNGNDSGDSTENQSPTEVGKKYKYVFTLNEEIPVYNYDTGVYGTEFTEDGTGFSGVYRNDFKTDNNQTLKISDLGEYRIDAEGNVISNPYVILEISPSSEVSQIRPHVGGQGFFDMTKEEYDSIVLTDEEKQIVKIQALQYLFEEHEKEVDTFTTSEYNKALKLQKEKTDAAKKALDAVIEEQTKLEEENETQQWKWSDKSLLKQINDLNSVKTDLGSSKGNIEDNRKNVESPYRKKAVDDYVADLKQELGKTQDYEIADEYNKRTGYSIWNKHSDGFIESDIINEKITLLLDPNSDLFNKEFYDEINKINEQINDINERIDNIDKQIQELEEKYDQNAIRLQEISEERPQLQATYDAEKAAQDAIKKETKKVADELNKSASIESGITALETFLIANTSLDEQYLKTFFAAREASALAYKKKYELSVVNVQTWDTSNYTYNYDYERFYAVDDNGNLQTYSTEGNKAEVKLTGNITTNNYVGEYVTTINSYNPLAQVGATVDGAMGLNGSSLKAVTDKAIIVNNYTFQKNCLDLGYDSKLNSTGTRIESQTPRIDEYIFAGWYVEVERNGKIDLVSIDEKDSNGNNIVTDAILSATTNLYTAWTYRYFDEETYYWLAPSAEESATVPIEFTSYDGISQCYTVHVPSSIASANRKLHHQNNQVTVCTGEKTNLVLKNGNTYVSDTAYSYVLETSAWDFDFSKSKYNTVESLKNVALKLMPDTDYYLLTYNAVPGVDKDGNSIITYYPYNVKVITIEPQELNKMVYYDYSVLHKGEAGYTSDNYMESPYLTQFLNNVDFIYLTNGGGSPYLGNTKKESYTHRSLSAGLWDGETVQNIPVAERTPTLYTWDNKKNELVYDSSKIVGSASWSTNLTAIPDLEWQVVEKIYSRSSDQEQVRKIAMIINEALADSIAGKVGTSVQIKSASGEQINGSDYNLCKLVLMYFSFKDPTKFYEYYINPEYQKEGYDRFDKVRGVAREDAPKSESYFTGSLYDYECWNTALFFPWELITEFTGHTHKDMLDQGKSSEMFNQLYPYNSFLDNLGKQLYASVGLATMSNFKNISNTYAFTFNGDNSLASDFFAYNREYLDNLTNAWDRQCFPEPAVYEHAGNSHLAFEYFESIGRGDDNPYGEVRDGYISAKSAIEYMVQNAQLAKDTELRRSITILNKLDPQSKFVYGNTIIRVDRVVMDDISQPDADVEFVFNGYEEGYYVVEYLWTNRYRNLDDENDEAQFWYSYYTNTAITDTSARWYKMPDSSGLADKESFFITKLIDAENNYVDNPSSYINHINRGTGYVFNAPTKPNVKLANGNDAPGTNNPTYIIIVKQYAKDDLQMRNLKSVTIKNVCIEKMSYLFNLD